MIDGSILICKYIIISLFIIYANISFGQCENKPNIQAAIKTKNITTITKAAEWLEHCNEFRDSLALVYHTLGVRHYVRGDMLNAIATSNKALVIRK